MDWNAEELRRLIYVVKEIGSECRSHFKHYNEYEDIYGTILYASI